MPLTRVSLLRLTSIVMVPVLLVPICGAAMTDVSSTLGSAVRSYARRLHGQFSQNPNPPFLGANPGRDPGRGIWTANQLAELDQDNNPLQASVLARFTSYPTTAVCSTSGASYPWEGKNPTAAGSLNTSNGNKLTTLHLLDWKVRGGGTFDLTLYHNSQSNYNGMLGENWSWTYDIYVNNSGSGPVVHWGDGTCVPYTTSGSTYAPPAGIYDQLVKNTGGTWTLTKKDGTTYQLNSYGYLTSFADRNGNTTTLTLNGNYYCTKVTDSTGRYITINYNGSYQITSIVDPLSRTWSFTYTSGNLTKVTWPELGSVYYTDQFGYNSNYCVTSHTDRRGEVWDFGYNSSEELASETDPLTHVWTYGYTSSQTTITDPLSHAAYDNYSSGILASHEDESGFSESYTSRDSNYNVKTLVDKRGNSWLYTWDSKGNMLTKEDPLTHTTTWTYNSSFAEPLTVTDALSNQTSITYDSHGNLLTLTDPLTHVQQTNTYDSYGECLTQEDALSHTTDFAWGSNGDLYTVTDPLSNVTTFTVDTLGRVTEITDPLSHSEQTAYDVWERPVTYTHPDSTTRTETFDACDNMTAETDENAHTTNWAFDSAGRCTSTTNPDSNVETYGYDNANRRTSVENGRSYTSTYTFTNRGEVSTLTLPDGAEEQWSYDGDGNTTGYENALTQTISYVFDTANRETAIDYPTGTDTTFSYDSADRRTQMVDVSGTTSWTFDNASRVTALGTPEGNLTYGFDNANRETSMVTSAGTTTYGYDNDNRRTSLDNPLSETTSWTFDNASRVTQQTFSGGQYDTYGYDSRNRITSLSHYTSGATLISGESYTLDNASNLSSKTVGSLTTTYGFDNANQLTSESNTGYSASYSYDANGNRSASTINGTSYTYNVDDGDKLNSITSGGTTVKSFGYDAAGRETSVVTSAGTTTLSYDYEDRVTGITYPSTATNSFSYNGFDTRVSKTDSAGSHSYLRDGAEVTSPVLSDGTAAYTPGVSQNRSGTTTYDLNDLLGSATRQTSTSATTTATRTYDAFGNLEATTGTPLGPFGFAGASDYQEDGDSGLKLLGHRYYDPSTGRFLTRDPAEVGRNWYMYCNNNPLRSIDPEGLEILDLIDGLQIIGGSGVGNKVPGGAVGVTPGGLKTWITWITGLALPSPPQVAGGASNLIMAPIAIISNSVSPSHGRPPRTTIGIGPLNIDPGGHPTNMFGPGSQYNHGGGDSRWRQQQELKSIDDD